MTSGYGSCMPSSWSREHPKSVASTGSVLVAVAVAGLVATVVGAVAIQARSFGPLFVITAIAGIAALVFSLPVLWRMARAGRLGPVRPAGGVGEEDATPVTEA